MNTRRPEPAPGLGRDKVSDGDTISTVPEGTVTHKIMLPFDVDEAMTVTRIHDDSATVDGAPGR